MYRNEKYFVVLLTCDQLLTNRFLVGNRIFLSNIISIAIAGISRYNSIEYLTLLGREACHGQQ